MSQSTVFEQEYLVRSINININKKLGLYGLLGMLQDAAGEHAESLGFGYDQMKVSGFFWVLIHQKLRMNRWPKWRETVTIKTWTLGIKGLKAIREFEIYIDGEKVGECATNWMTLDAYSRRPKMIAEEDYSFAIRKDYSLSIEADKIKMPADLKSIRELKVGVSDLDMNIHVNNVKYTQWVLDSIPLKVHQEFEIREYDINFLTEAFLDDRIECESDVNSDQQPDSNPVIHMLGRNVETGKPVFNARVKALKI